MFKRVIALPVAAASLLLAATAAGCAGSSGPSEDSPQPGNATPAASAPQDQVSPDGEVVPAPAGLGEVTGIASLGDTVALAGTEGIAFGSPAQFRSGSVQTQPTAPECAGLTAGADAKTFVLACGDTIRLFRLGGADRPADVHLEDVRIDSHRATQAVLARSGELFFANDQEANVVLRRPDGSQDVIDVEKPADQLVITPVLGGRDGVVRMWREDTTVQDLDWTNEPPRAGGRLRMGLGVGTIAPGPEGLVLAADAVGRQIGVYTASDVIRLHQTRPTEGSPWAVAWDQARGLAWASLTDTQKLEAFDISSGVPEPVGEHAAVADAQFLTVLDDATVVAASASGRGVQFIAPPQK